MPEVKPDKSIAPGNPTNKTKAFEDHLNQYPGAHFLSPARVYGDEYDDWSSDSDDDAEDFEWNAGVTDFALFDSDRRRAKATGQALPERWNDLLQSQASALDRSVDRIRVDEEVEKDKDELMPDLTPDVSPHLVDNLGAKTSSSQAAPSAIVPSYLRSRDDDAQDSESAVIDDDLTIAFFPPPERRRPRPRPAPVRPGLSRGSRTLSGKLHSWQRPGLDLSSVKEDPSAEHNAELSSPSA